MAAVQHILKEIGQLTMEELQELLHSIRRRIALMKKFEKAVDAFVEESPGIWPTDAQSYVDSLREG
jgi:hypothetical protein